MAYKQNNPLSRTSSSPLFRKQGVSPINNRRLDPDAKKIAYPKTGPSRKSSSPLNTYPTTGTFAGSIEAAEKEHAPGPNEEYVDISEKGDESILDLQTRLGDTSSFGSSLVDGAYQGPGGGEGYLDTNRNRIVKHPLGIAGTARGTDVSNSGRDYWTGITQKALQPTWDERPKPYMMPVGDAHYSIHDGSRYPGLGRIQTDIYSNIDPNAKWSSFPSINPWTGSATHPKAGESTMGIKNQQGFASNYYKGSNLGKNTPWQYASERFGDNNGGNLVQEGMTAYGANSPAVYPFFSNERGQNSSINQTENQRGQDNILTKNFSDFNREVKNLQNFEDAYSTYINKNTMDPNKLYSYDQKDPRINFDFSERFKTELPQILAGGEPVGYATLGREWAQPELYDKENSMFKDALTSSRFTGGGVDADTGAMLNRDIDNPVDIMTKMVNNGEMTFAQAQEYLSALRNNTFSGKF